MMGAMAKSEQNPTKHCNPKKGPVDCCQENCSKIITYEKPERFSIAGKRIGIEPLQTINTCLSIVSDSSPTKFPLEPYLEPYRLKIKSPPIFVTVSSFLI